MWSEASGRGFTLIDIARWMAEGPARLAGSEPQKGRIAKNFDADFVVFEPEAEFTATEDRLSTVTAFHPIWVKNFAVSSRQPICAENVYSPMGNFQESQAGANCGGNWRTEASNRDLKLLHFIQNTASKEIYDGPSHRRGIRAAQGRRGQSHRSGALRRRHGFARHALWGDGAQQHCARKRSARFHLIRAWPGRVILVTAKDIPGKNCIALILDDQPCLALKQ